MKPISQEKKKEFNAILADLDSKDDQIVLASIKKLRDQGNEVSTQKIIALLANELNPTVEQEVINYLFDLKSEAAVQPLLDAIENPLLRKYKSKLISVFWQSSLDGSDHMLFLIEQVYEASFEEILEILTVIENFDGPFQEEELFEAIARLNELAQEEMEEQNIPLISSLIEVLNQF